MSSNDNLGQDGSEHAGHSENPPAAIEEIKRSRHKKKAKDSKKKNKGEAKSKGEAKKKKTRGIADFSRILGAVILGGSFVAVFTSYAAEHHLVARVECMLQTLPDAPEHDELGILVALGEASKDDVRRLTNSLESRLQTVAISKIKFFPICGKLPDAKVSKWLAYANGYMVINAENLRNRTIKGDVLTKLDEQSEPQIFPVTDVFDSPELAATAASRMVRWSGKVTGNLTTTLRGTPDLGLVGPAAPNPQFQKLSVVASIPALRQDCSLQFHRGVHALFSPHPDDAEPHFAEVTGPTCFTNSEHAPLALYAQGMLRVRSGKRSTILATKVNEIDAGVALFRQLLTDNLGKTDPQLFSLTSLQLATAISLLPPHHFDAATLRSDVAVIHRARLLAADLKNGLFEQLLSLEDTIGKRANLVQEQQERLAAHANAEREAEQDRLKGKEQRARAEGASDATQAAQKLIDEQKALADKREADLASKLAVTSNKLEAITAASEVQSKTIEAQNQAISDLKTEVDQISRAHYSRIKADEEKKAEEVNKRKPRVTRSESRPTCVTIDRGPGFFLQRCRKPLRTASR